VQSLIRLLFLFYLYTEIFHKIILHKNGSYFLVGCLFLFFKIVYLFLVLFVKYTYVCRMRKEINLGEGVVARLQILADKKKWSVKKYMEYVLENNSKRATVTLANKLKNWKP
jgi:hypothetical protein